MPGIALSSLDPRSGARLHRYFMNVPPALANQATQIFGVSAAWVGANGEGIVRLQNPGGLGRIVRALHLTTIAAAAATNFDAILHVLRGRNWAVGPGVHVPLMYAVQTIPANNPIMTQTPFTLVPDDQDASDVYGSLTDSGDATEDTLPSVAAFPALANVHVGNEMQRLDTLEKATLLTYTAGRVVTHAAWTLGTADAPTGTPFKVKHLNRLVKDGDAFSITTSNVGGTPPTGQAFMIDVLELGLSGNNQQ